MMREEEGTCAMENFEATEKIRSVVDRVFRARGARRSPKKSFAVVRSLFTLG